MFRFWIAERDTATGEVIRDAATNKLKGRSREMGLGSFATVSLAEARDRALECRKLREKDIDPIDAREAAKREAALQRAKSLKFKDAAEAYMAAHRVAWKNDKHAAQWPATLKTYAYPIIGELPLQLIDTTLVMKVIDPLWSEKPETASRLRGRISRCSTGPRCAAIAKVKIRLAGAAISINYCRREQKCARSSITARCPMPNCQRSWSSCVSRRALPRGRSSSPSSPRRGPTKPSAPSFLKSTRRTNFGLCRRSA